jgi:hypothetical protein
VPDVATVSVTDTDTIYDPHTSYYNASTVSIATISTEEFFTSFPTTVDTITATIIATTTTTTTYMFSPKPAPTLGSRENMVAGSQARVDVGVCSDIQQVITQTLPASTMTSTSTVFVTPSAVTASQLYDYQTTTTTITSSQQTNVTITSTIQTSLTETTVYTTLQPITIETTTTATATSHVAGPTLWCEMKIRTSGDGDSDGRYIYSENTNLIAPAGSSTQGSFRLDSQGVMHTLHSKYKDEVWTGFWAYSYVSAPQALAVNNFIPNECQVDSITLEVFCQGNPTYNPSGHTGPWRWLAEEASDGTHLSLTHLDDEIYQRYTSDYQQIRLFAEPINCVS